MERPLVTIACTTYNHEKYIGQTIDAFLEQRTTFPVEIIINDDASTDNTPRIIREYAENHPGLIVPIFQAENQYSKGRKPFIEFVLPRARGTYIALCEGDDYWTDPAKLQKQVDFLEANPDYVLCYHNARIVDEYGALVSASKLPDDLKRDLSAEELIRGAMILTLTLCFRNIVKEIPEELFKVYNGDKFFTSLLGRHGKGKYMDDITDAVYRKHSDSIWSSLDPVRQIYHNGVTRAWMHRYYKRIGETHHADYFRDQVIMHFTRTLQEIAARTGKAYDVIVEDIFSNFTDIVDQASQERLRSLMTPARQVIHSTAATASSAAHLTAGQSGKTGAARLSDVPPDGEYMSCTYIENAIAFYYDNLVYTCCYPGYIQDEGILADLSRGPLNTADIIARKREIIRRRMNKEFGGCAGCPRFVKKRWRRNWDISISHVNLNHLLACNLKCLHCGYVEKVGRHQPTSKESIMDAVATLQEGGLLEPGAEFYIGNGEPSINADMDDLIAFLLDRNYSVVVQSNGTVYKDIYAAGVNAGKLRLILTPDAGTRDSYLKIKGRDYFHRVWRNIRKYASETSGNITVKLILQEGNINDAEPFLDLCDSARVRDIVVDVDLHIRDRISKEIAAAAQRFVEYARQRNLTIRPGNHWPQDHAEKFKLDPQQGVSEGHGGTCTSPHVLGGTDTFARNPQTDKPFDVSPSDLDATDDNARRRQGHRLRDALDRKGWSHKYDIYARYFEHVRELRRVTDPTISVIVISWRLHPDNLRSFQILQEQRSENFELIFVDNGGQPGEFTCLEPFIDTLVRLNENTGAYLARNIGAAFSRAPILLFLEDDGIPEKNLIRAHLELFDKYDIIACRGLYVPKTDNPLNNQQGHYYVGDTEYPTFAHVEGITTYRADVFFQAGGWDDEIRFGGGGLELSFRLLSIDPDKRKQIYSPAPVIYHDYVTDEAHLENKLAKQALSFERLRRKYPLWDETMKNYRLNIGRDDLLIRRGDATAGQDVPAISLVVTVGPDHRQAMRTLASLGCQDVSGVELVLAYPGEGDTRDAVKEWIAANPAFAVRTFEHAPGEDASVLDQAVGQARGRYILWISPGVELVDPEAIRILKSTIDDHFDADILYSHKLAVHDPAKEPGMVLFKDWYARKDDLADAMAVGLCIPTDMLLVRKDLYRLVGGYKTLPPGRCQETFVARVAGMKRYNLKLIDEVLYRSPHDEPYTSLDDASREDVRQVTRVLYVNHNVYPIERSGTPLSTLHHALGMARRGVETAVLIPAPELEDNFSREPREGFTLYRVPAMNKFDAYCAAPGEDATAWYRKIIEDVIDDFCPQVVQVNDYVYMPAEIVEIFARRGCIVVRNVCNCEELCHQDYPVLSSGLDGRLCLGPKNPGTCADCLATLPEAALRNLAPQNQSHPVGKKIEDRFAYVRRLYRDAVDMVVFTSEPFRDYFTRFIPIPHEKTRVIPRGFDFAFPRPTARNSRPGGILHFAFVGNIMFSKGIDVALRAFERVCGRGGFVFHVYGQIVNPEYQQWLDRLQSAHPESFIYQGAFTDGDLPSIAAAIDVCIVPSYFDTYNRVLREFIYLGVPVIATDFFGAFIVQDGINGFRIPVGDADALAGKMLDLINTPSLVDDLARGAMQTQIPGLDEEIDALLETYRDLYAHVSGKRKVRMARMLTTRRKRSPSVAGKKPGKAYVLQARSALAEGRLEDAQGLLDKALSRDPADPRALHQLALLRHRQGDLRQAVELLQKAVALAPGDAELTNDLGTLCYLNGDHDRAVTLFYRAVNLDRTLLDARRNLADLLAAQGRLKEAERQYTEVLRQNPGDTDAQEALERIKGVAKDSSPSPIHCAHTGSESSDDLIQNRFRNTRACTNALMTPAMDLLQDGRSALPETQDASKTLGKRRPVATPETTESTSMEKPRKDQPAPADRAVRFLAFYLPQYHPIPENDRWWGKGFTEWTNVAKARPLFEGHYQPHIPADLGFYDLRLAETREAQAELARSHGISGFCYYHYWFKGRRLLNRVFDEVLASGRPDFPFCLCWANENWTRVWDGGDKKILMRQDYGEEDDLAHIRWLLAAFKDPRYIKIHGRPLFLVYRAGGLPDPSRTAALWRKEAKRAGFPDLYLCRVESFADEQTPPAELGFDAAVEFQPDWSMLGLKDDTYPDLHVYDYGDVVQRMMSKPQPGYLRFPCVTPSWDNTPRRGKDGVVLHGSTPELYGKWLESAVRKACANAPEERIVFINAWNEWAEGNHLEPDLKHGTAYLETTRRVARDEDDPARLCESLTKKALKAADKGEADFARKLFEAALSHDPHSPATLHHYGSFLFSQGKPADARDRLVQALEADPSNPEYHNDLAAVLHALGDTEKAIESLEKALEADPEYAPALKNLTEVLLESGQIGKASETCQRLLSIHPDDAEASSLWNTVRKELGETEEPDLSHSSAHARARTFSRQRPEGVMCLMPFTTMTLSFLGVYNCACPDWIKMKIGDLGASTIADTWNSEQARWIRAKMYEGKWEEICNWFCPHVITHEKTGRLHRYDELEAGDLVTAQLAEEIRQGRTRLDSTPLVFKLDNSQICNLSCIMCSRFLHREDPVMLAKTTDDLRRHLPAARRIVMSGFGDPLARPDTRALLMDEELGHLKFDLITNALLLPRFWDRIRHQNFGDLLVSIDAADKKTYETIRRGGVWEDLLESLALIEKNREKFDSITLNMTVMRENYRSIPAFIDLALSRGFKASFQRIRGPYPWQNIFDPPDEDALRTLQGIVEHELAKRDTSRVFFGDLLVFNEHTPGSTEAPGQEALRLFEQGMLAEAIAAMERAVANDPDNAVLHNDLGAMYHASGEASKARACFEKALDLDPTYAPSLKNLTELFMEMGRPDDARATCSTLISLHPADEEAGRLWAVINGGIEGGAPVGNGAIQDTANTCEDTPNSIRKNREQWSNYEWTEAGDEWSACWGGTGQLWERTIKPRISSFLPSGHILEIAPGFGRCTQYLVPECSELTLVDLTEKCIEACRKRFQAHSHIRCFVNDGKSLDMLEDDSIDFAFSWDSLVHVEKDVMRSYLHELSAKLKPGGAAFLHHSNMGAFLDPTTGKLTVKNDHWRGEDMSAKLFRDFCLEAGLKCVSQEILAWGGDVLNDCFSVVVKEPGYDPDKTVVVENPDFMDESKGRKNPPAIYGAGCLPGSGQAAFEHGEAKGKPGGDAPEAVRTPCTLSIVMCVSEDADRAVRSVKSLLRGLPRHGVELIVAAPAGGGQASDRLERLQNDGLTLVIPEGPCTEVNRCVTAAKKASGRFLALTDDSVLFSKTWLPEIMKAIDESDGFDALVGKTVTVDGLIVEAGSSSPGKDWLEGRGEGSVLHDPAYSFSCLASSGSRYAMLVSRRAWDDMDGLDEGLEHLGCALVDLGLRMVSRGFGILYQPQCVLVANDGVSSRAQEPASLSLAPGRLASLRPRELAPGILQAVSGSGRRRVLVLGIYLANTLNTVTDLVGVFSRSRFHDVTQKWVALNGPAPDAATARVTVRELTGRFPKFQIVNDLLAGEDLKGYDYVILCDDDVVLPEGFVDSFVGLQERLGFAVAQPARTLNSYIDHPIVQQHIGVHARQTLFVEIGPVVSFHRSSFDFVFPFDLTSPMGWGYENVWAREVLTRGLKMGIIDAVCVDHSIRKPVANYDWSQADEQRNAYLAGNPHLALEDCFTVLEAHLIAEERV